MGKGVTELVMNEAIVSFIQSFRIQDFFDILIITSLIYVILIWFKNAASRLVFVGISLLGGIYIIARLFNLYLTTLALQGFFTTFIIALVVIFQEDTRRFFERLATWRTIGKSRKKTDSVHDSTIEVVIESVADLASKRTGALIVLKGEDPLERHIKGGYHLDGVITKPILASIFDIHSIGHDGAVIINKDRLIKFGCHLPLSINTEKFGEFGLRHTAALGLSERCDALCIVVSEERGTITVAQNDEIKKLKNAAELRIVMEKYYENKLTAQARKSSTRWFRQNTMEKALALVLALGLWFVFGYQKDSVQRDYIVPIEYRKVSQEWEIEESREKEATITLMGSSQAFNLFEPRNLKISIDLSSLEEGRQVIKLSADMVNIPSNMTLVKIKPERITIVAHQLFPREVSVHIDATGRLPDKYILKRVSVTPETVMVLAPFNLMGNKIFIATEPIDISEITATQSVETRIVYPSQVRFKNNQVPTVRVIIEVERKTTEKH
jgi:diadenylate cyclase